MGNKPQFTLHPNIAGAASGGEGTLVMTESKAHALSSRYISSSGSGRKVEGHIVHGLGNCAQLIQSFRKLESVAKINM